MVGKGVSARTQTSFPEEGKSNSFASQERGVLPVEQARVTLLLSHWEQFGRRGCGQVRLCTLCFVHSLLIYPSICCYCPFPYLIAVAVNCSYGNL